MRRAALAVTLAFAAQAAGAAPSRAVFEQLVLDRLAAYGRGDGAAYLALLSPDYVHVSETGMRRTYRDMAGFVAAHGGNGARYRLEGVTMRTLGPAVLFEAEVVEDFPGGTGRFRETDIFRLSGKDWRYVSHQETPVLAPPRPVAVPPAVLDDYAGRYVVTGGWTEVIVRDGDMLVSRDTRESAGRPLTAISGEAFVAADDPSMLVFVRNEAGRVSHYLLRLPSGRVVIARKTD